MTTVDIFLSMEDIERIVQGGETIFYNGYITVSVQINDPPYESEMKAPPM